MTEEQLLTVREVARRCRRSEETVRRWIWSGKLPARKIGNQHFVARVDVDKYAAPRVAEGRVAYASGRARPDPVSDTHWPYDPEQKLRELEEDVEFGRWLRKEYGSVDVTELIQQIREDDNE
jgi:excisionase family DNA binding protein